MTARGPFSRISSRLAGRKLRELESVRVFIV